MKLKASLQSQAAYNERYKALACFIREDAARSNNEREIWQEMIPIVRV
jgi:hypothetical protein